MEKKLRVMHVLKSSIYSGAENVVITIMNYLVDEYDFLYVASDGTIREKLNEEKIAYRLLGRFDRNALKGIIGEWEPDVVHAHDFSATVLCASIWKLRGVKSFQLISHLHYDPPWSHRWNLKTILYLLSSKKISRILTVSEKSYNHMIFSNKLRGKCRIVGNPIDSKKIYKLSKEMDLIDSIDLIFVGRLEKQKNPQRFIEIVRKLSEEKSIYCMMIGAGKLEKECRDMIQTYGLEERVRLMRYQANPYPFIKASKILCMTSRWEGYGLVLIEANILEIPVLSTRTAGAEEVLGENADEICDTDGEFVNKIKFMLDNEKQYIQMKALGKGRISRMPSIKEYMGLISECYKTLRGD